MTNYQLLEARVARLAARRRRLRVWSILGATWLCAAALAGAVLLLENRLGARLSFAAPIIFVSAGAGALLLLFYLRKGPRDLRAEAQQIEREYPGLDGRLLTALRLPPPGDNASGYLQERV